MGTLSVTIMIGNDLGLEYLDDGWRLTLGPERVRVRLDGVGAQCLLTALVR